jgi:DTW domain-containing protein YfiP
LDELRLPDHISEKIIMFPESSMNANRVTLLLKNNRKIEHVFIADATWVVKIDTKIIRNKNDIDFCIEDIIDVISET